MNLICCQKDENSANMMTAYVDVLNTIVRTSEKFDQGEHILIGGWIDRYFSDCSRHMFGNLTQILIEIFQKCHQVTNTDANHGKFFLLKLKRKINTI